MKMLLLVVSITFLNFVLIESSSETNKAFPVHTQRDIDAHDIFSSSAIKYKPSINKTRLFDNEDNILYFPKTIHYDKEYNKKKTFKKTPKRTIQKIIKTKQAKRRISKLNHVTKPTTEQTESDENDAMETTSQFTTTQVHKKNMNIKHRKKKFVPRQTRMANPFLKFKKDQESKYRVKRNTGITDREFYILQDLDEVKFISGEDRDNDEIVAHIKNYWK